MMSRFRSRPPQMSNTSLVTALLAGVCLVCLSTVPAQAVSIITDDISVSENFVAFFVPDGIVKISNGARPYTHKQSGIHILGGV